MQAKQIINHFLLVVVLAASTTTALAEEYQSPEVFLDETFSGSVPKPDVVWLKGDVKQVVRDILGHNYPALRIRYWQVDQRTAWILEEIGKEKPITVGLVVDTDQLERVKVLAFRESRGWEVRYPFFTDQFAGIGLDDDRDLNGYIDGISGATLSVRALKKLARMALYLHAQALADNGSTS